MTGPVIPADQWPEDAYMHTWDGATKAGYWTAPDAEGGHWTIRKSGIPMPAGWDWRVPVMRHQPAQVIDMDLVREAVELAIAHAGPNDGSLAGWQRLLALIDGQATPNDSQRLEWVMRNISGTELRRLNVWTAANCDREAIDDAMSEQPTKGEEKE